MADFTSVKAEPTDAPSPSLTDDGLYEDAGDLEFGANVGGPIYLTRVPAYVWEAWSKLDDDAEIQIGTVRVTPNGPGQDANHQLLLDRNLAIHQTVPKEYELQMADSKPRNTFLFTEQDLPGFKSKSAAKFDAASANMPARLTQRLKSEKPGAKQAYDPNKRFQPYYRKAIPKRTTLLGKVSVELGAVAVMTEEATHLLAMRTIEAMKPKVAIKFLSNDFGDISRSLIQPGTIRASESFGGFIKTKGSNAGKSSQMQKAARIPQNELLDKLFALFKQYNYWSMKALREKTQQPEVYLRETLEKVAVLAKSGPFATHWSLKPENRPESYIDSGEHEAMAPTAEADDTDFGDDDDEDVKFEDV